MEAATNIALPQTEPLRPDEKQWLMDTYNKLVSKMWRGFVGNAIILVLFSISPLGYIVYAFINDAVLSGNDTWLVDTDTYNKCDEGATVYVEQVPRSKYIFSDNEDYMSLSF